MEMRGIEPRAFHMQSERSTTELHPPYSITVFCFYGYPTTSERQTPWGCCNFADSCEHWYGTRLNYYYVAAIYLFFVLSLLPFLLSLIDFSIQRFFSSLFFDFPKVGQYYVYGHIMLKAPVLVRSLKLSNIESR